MKKWIPISLVVVGIAVAIGIKFHQMNANDAAVNRQRRQVFVDTMNESFMKTPGVRVKPMWLEGADEDGIVFAVSDCNLDGLRLMISPAGLTKVLDDIDVAYVRCDNGYTRLTPPRW